MKHTHLLQPEGLNLKIHVNRFENVFIQIRHVFLSNSWLTSFGSPNNIQPYRVVFEWIISLTPNRYRFIGGYSYLVLRTIPAILKNSQVTHYRKQESSFGGNLFFYTLYESLSCKKIVLTKEKNYI